MASERNEGYDLTMKLIAEMSSVNSVRRYDTRYRPEQEESGGGRGGNAARKIDQE